MGRGVTGKVAQLRNADPPTASASAQSDSGFPFVAVYVPSSSIEGIGGLPSRAEVLHSNMKNTASTQKQDNQNQQQNTATVGRAWLQSGLGKSADGIATGIVCFRFCHGDCLTMTMIGDQCPISVKGQRGQVQVQLSTLS